MLLKKVDLSLGRRTYSSLFSLHQRFIAITGASERVALQALKVSDWYLEGAIDVFYSQPRVQQTSTDSRHLEKLYNRYRDPYADMILADGINTLCNDLMEFIGGLQSLGIDMLERFCERLPYIRSELSDNQKFKEIFGVIALFRIQSLKIVKS
ncbi:putative defective-in-cullin neddylation protein [Helianthus annuus]|uniref:Defective in cullin neddylation protein n=1 Tax=Helianthus annuus TaxID=4232 RepID=A0A251SU68_HELAN|nr:putative defective-in-cullin neddylation protein [Helianthus annuus]KAJ0477551.1 putative defective-in-cullin neddylation protein [Helianthus annuus]KAJ0482047.1 putative defective-in-cullin neddylation protein [Helianthus annuus]KAJ0498381.1 putative defective-in-cullin neddylation protein [Helianthus annuus]KAJ0664391.1 putative defective-in-cullin neddylation protein [Helianthus annuus]